MKMKCLGDRSGYLFSMPQGQLFIECLDIDIDDGEKNVLWGKKFVFTQMC